MTEYVLVPREPTPEMMDAGVDAAVNKAKGRPWFPFAWEAAIAAAPVRATGGELREDWQAVSDAVAYAPEDVRDAARLALYRLDAAPQDGEADQPVGDRLTGAMVVAAQESLREAGAHLPSSVVRDALLAAQEAARG